MSGYVPPLSEVGSPCDYSSRLADGVFGYAIETDGRVYIPDINAEVEGDGRVGKFLDSLDERCVIANVTSGRLAGMLERRGWQKTIEDNDEFGPVDVWLHPRGKGAKVSA